MNRDFLYLDGPSKTCLDSILEGVMWFRLWDNQPVGTDGRICSTANCRAPELENSADCDVQVQTHDYSVIPHKVIRTRWPPKPVEIFCQCKGQVEKQNQTHLLNLGGPKKKKQDKTKQTKMTGVAVWLHSRVYFVSTLNVQLNLQNTLKEDNTS